MTRPTDAAIAAIQVFCPISFCNPQVFRVPRGPVNVQMMSIAYSDLLGQAGLPGVASSAICVACSKKQSKAAVKSDVMATPRSKPRRPGLKTQNLPVRATLTQPMREQYAKSGIDPPIRFEGPTASELRQSASPVFFASRSQSLTNIDGQNPKRLELGSSEWPLESARDAKVSSRVRTPRSPLRNAVASRLTDTLSTDRREPSSARSPRSRSVSPLRLSYESYGTPVRSSSPLLKVATEESGRLEAMETAELKRLLMDTETAAQAANIQLAALRDALLHMQHQPLLTTTESKSDCSTQLRSALVF